MVVVFDVVGTLLNLERVAAALVANGAPGDLHALLFARLHQNLMAATLAGRYEPFAEVAEHTLRQLLVSRGRGEAVLEPVLEALRELDPWSDAPDCLARMQGAGHQLVAFADCSLEVAQRLLDRAGLTRFFGAVHSSAEVRACRPHPATYGAVLARAGCRPEQATLVSVHAFDVVGADAVGLQTVWVRRLERHWPFAGHPPGRVAATLADVDAAL